jgi:hypothetical protein
MSSSGLQNCYRELRELLTVDDKFLTALNNLNYLLDNVHVDDRHILAHIYVLLDMKVRQVSTESALLKNIGNNKNRRLKNEQAEIKKNALMKWLEQNLDNPYPTQDMKFLLSSQTGMTIKQLDNWFINARRRVVPRYLKK